jgi:hypothetical protein
MPPFRSEILLPLPNSVRWSQNPIWHTVNNALSITVKLLVHAKVLDCSVVNTPSRKRVRKNLSEVLDNYDEDFCGKDGTFASPNLPLWRSASQHLVGISSVILWRNLKGLGASSPITINLDPRSKKYKDGRRHQEIAPSPLLKITKWHRVDLKQSSIFVCLLLCLVWVCLFEAHQEAISTSTVEVQANLRMLLTECTPSNWCWHLSAQM